LEILAMAVDDPIQPPIPGCGMSRPSGPDDDIEHALGHRFSDPDLLRQALTHVSTLTEQGDGGGVSYERLEFLGDRVLGLVVAAHLYERFPGEDEGDLAQRFAFLVRRDALAEIAGRLNLGAHIAVSAGEAAAGGRENPSLLADACESVIAALYLDGGLSVAERFIRDQWRPLVDADPTPPKDVKTALQEWAQARGLALPAYQEIGREGPAHAPHFHVEVTVTGLPPETGSGSSKQSAEVAAAETLLERIARDER
jgi:ribonuclease-3